MMTRCSLVAHATRKRALLKHRFMTDLTPCIQGETVARSIPSKCRSRQNLMADAARTIGLVLIPLLLLVFLFFVVIVQVATRAKGKDNVGAAPGTSDHLGRHDRPLFNDRA